MDNSLRQRQSPSEVKGTCEAEARPAIGPESEKVTLRTAYLEQLEVDEIRKGSRFVFSAHPEDASVEPSGAVVLLQMKNVISALT